MNKQKKLILASIVSIVILLFVVAVIYFNRQTEDSNPCDSKTGVALVNGNCVLKEAFNVNLKRAEMIANNASESAKKSREEIIAELVDAEIIDEYAKENNITVSEFELQDKYTKAYQSLGSEEEYLKKIQELQGIGKSEVLELIRQDILKEKVQKSLGTPIENWLAEQRAKSKIELFNK